MQDLFCFVSTSYCVKRFVTEPNIEEKTWLSCLHDQLYIHWAHLCTSTFLFHKGSYWYISFKDYDGWLYPDHATASFAYIQSTSVTVIVILAVGRLNLAVVRSHINYSILLLYTLYFILSFQWSTAKCAAALELPNLNCLQGLNKL